MRTLSAPPIQGLACARAEVIGMNEADAALRVAGRRGGKRRAAVLAIVVTLCALLTAALISLVMVGYQWIVRGFDW